MALKQAARDMKDSTTTAYLGAGNTFDSHNEEFVKAIKPGRLEAVAGV